MLGQSLSMREKIRVPPWGVACLKIDCGYMVNYIYKKKTK